MRIAAVKIGWTAIRIPLESYLARSGKLDHMVGRDAEAGAELSSNFRVANFLFNNHESR